MIQKGFSLVELLVVIALVAILSTVVMFQISNTPKENARDALRKNDINKIADAYDLTALEGNSYSPIDKHIPKPPEGGDYQGLLSSVSGEYLICAQLEKGKDINCLEHSNNPKCYCRSSRGDHGGGNGHGDDDDDDEGPNHTPTPTPSASVIVSSTPTPTPVATPTPTPAGNPFGQAIAFNGKPAYLNPPSYAPLPEFVKANYDPKMNLTSEQVTVEAWIKPTAPTTSGHHYRIVDNTYRLTMTPQPNNGQVSYKYYFDVQSNENGPCGQTVIQSDPRLDYDPWNINYYKTVSVSEFESWKHVVGVFKNSVFYIFENGVLLNTYDTVGRGHAHMTICNDGRALHIGAGLYGKSTPYYDNFQGLIDEVRISDIARYTSNYTVPSLPFTPDANTEMLYHFDSTTTDSSQNGLNGGITGVTEYQESTIINN